MIVGGYNNYSTLGGYGAATTYATGANLYGNRLGYATTAAPVVNLGGSRVLAAGYGAVPAVVSTPTIGYSGYGVQNLGYAPVGAVGAVQTLAPTVAYGASPYGALSTSRVIGGAAYNTGFATTYPAGYATGYGYTNALGARYY